MHRRARNGTTRTCGALVHPRREPPLAGCPLGVKSQHGPCHGWVLADLAFSEPTGAPAWKRPPSWTVVATGDKGAGADVNRSTAERSGSTITEVDGSHVIMISKPDPVTEVILNALSAVGSVAAAA
jgi:hypothetical protein